jgi:hemerythrin-like metal-binding protein
VEAEHALQYKLLGEAERLLQSGDRAAAREVIVQLHSYSDAHFASEQVLMRLHSYPGYAAHEREHGELLHALEALLGSLDAEDLSGAAATLRRWLTSHIHHSDQSFLEFMNAPIRAAGA